MRKIAFIVMLVFGLIGVMSATVSAAYDPSGGICTGSNVSAEVKASAFCSDPKNATTNPLTGPDGAFRLAANIVAVLAGIVAVISIMLAGFRYITSGGDPSKVKGAKDALVAALVGIAIIALSQTIVSFVLGRL